MSAVPSGKAVAPASGSRLLAIFILVGAAVAVALGVFGRVHTATGQAITTLGFPTLMSMKVTLATIAGLLGIVQIVTALRMYERIGRGPATRRIAITHRVSGVTAVIVSAPVAFHCLWSLGFGTYETRVLVHSLLGCAFYGVFVTKMLSLRSSHVPSWAVPWLGGLLFTLLVGLWFSSAVWFLVGAVPDY